MNAVHSHNRPTNLYPKEHGAYAMLAIPLLTALITSGLTVAGVCIGAAAVAGFLAHEPLLIALGHRGQRAQQSTPQARWRLISLLAIAWFAGSTALLMGGFSLQVALTICFAFAAISFAMSIAGWHRKSAVHLWGMLGLSMPCIPILMAGDSATPTAMTFWAVWLLGFGATTIGVRGMLANQKRKPIWLHVLTLSGLTISIAVGIAMNVSWMLVTLPMIGVSWYLLISLPPIKQLKQVGWTMVVGTMSTAIMTVVAFI